MEIQPEFRSTETGAPYLESNGRRIKKKRLQGPSVNAAADNGISGYQGQKRFELINR